MEISALAISNSGKMLASGQLGTIFQKNPEAPVILWDFPARTPLAVLKGLSISVKRLTFSPDDRYLAAIGESNIIIIWDTSDGSAIYTRIFETTPMFFSWGDMLTEKNPKHPSYILVVGFHNQIKINTLEFDIGSMQYFVKEGLC